MGTRRWGASSRAFESIGVCRMLWLVLLEVARIILPGESSDRRMVSSLCEASPYRGNQCILLLMAHRREREGVATAAPQAGLRLHRQSLRAHYSYQEVQGHKNIDQRFWYDRRYIGQSNGMLFIPASAKLSLHEGE